MELLNSEVRMVISEETDLIESVLLNDEEIYLSDNFDDIYTIFEEAYEIDGTLLFHKDEFNNIDYFIKLIDKVNNDPSIKSVMVPDYSFDEDFELEDDDLPKIKIVKKCYLSEKIEYLASDYLICNNGRPNYDNISELTKNGIIVSPGETDSFGWLSGIIKTNKGSLIFG